MTREEFQKKYSGDYAVMLASPMGQAMSQVLASLIPAYEYSKEPHLYADNRGKRAGYEDCLRKILSIHVPVVARREVEPNYGVPNQPTK